MFKKCIAKIKKGKNNFKDFFSFCVLRGGCGQCRNFKKGREGGNLDDYLLFHAKR